MVCSMVPNHGHHGLVLSAIGLVAFLHLGEAGTHLDAPWFHWQGGKVHFYFQGMENADRRVMRAAMRIIERKTCLTFKEEKGPLAGHHLRIQGSQTPCLSGPGSVPTFSATVGATPPNRTEVVLQSYYQLADSARCVNESRGGLMHELFHVFGVMHTQKRQDRNRHVKILKENIQDPFEFSYDICHECKDYGVPYDCDSIMHFGTETFSLGKPTMEAQHDGCDLRWVGAAFDGRHGREVGSPSDWLLLNRIGDRLCSPSAAKARPRTSPTPRTTRRPRTSKAPRTTTTRRTTRASRTTRRSVAKTNSRPARPAKASRRPKATRRPSQRKPRTGERALPAPWKRRPRPNRN